MELSSLLPSSPLSLLASLLLVFLVHRFYLVLDATVLTPYRRYRILLSQGIRGPSFKPLIGDLLMVRRYSNEYKRLVMGEEQRAIYGTNWQFSIGPFNILGLGDPDYVFAAYKTQYARSYHKGVLTKTMLGSLFGPDSLVIIDNPAHARHRKMIAPAFHYAQLSNMASIMIAETGRKVDELCAAMTDGEVGVELHALFIALTFRIIMSSSFGDSLERIPHASSTIHHALTVTLPILQKRQLALVEYIPLVRDLPILGKREGDKGKRDMEAVVMQMVEGRRAGTSHSNCDGNDLLDILLNARDPDTGLGFSNDIVRSNVMTFVLAGHETTSSAVTFIIRDLLLRPALYAQCREEVERVTQGGPLVVEHLASLTIIDACIHETMRLRPPVPGISIQASEDHWLQPEGRPALFIPAGTCIGTDIYTLHTSTELWGDNAKEWNHERWVKGSAHYHRPKHPVAYNPFSVGSRSCIGNHFGVLEIRVIVALLVRELDMELEPGQQVDVITQKLTIEPAYGIRVKVRRRADRATKAAAYAERKEG